MSNIVICKRCIMDSTAENIHFDENGYCNYCSDLINKIKKNSLNNNSNSLDALIEKIKANGKGKKYDCIIGVSGGVDSSYVLHLAKEKGLRPLAVHMDNGWNSELATSNISNLVNKLGVDLYTHVIDWNEYRNMMQAFFDADVIDIELLYDNAMLAVNYALAQKYNIKYILAGTNTTTEGMAMPKNWNWFKYDKKNIYSIVKKFNSVKIKTFPSIGTLKLGYMTYVKGAKWVSFLDYFDYDKNRALEILKTYDYKPYPYKHYESVFTRFYQGYILPTKFNVDKRKIHLSTLICSGQMSREDAVNIMNNIAYPSSEALAEDREYFLKKMSWSEDMLEAYLSRPEKKHNIYGSEKDMFEFFNKIRKSLNKNKQKEKKC